VTNSEGGLEKRGSRHDALESGKFHRRQARERAPLPKATEKRKKSLRESDTPQQELSRCLNEMFLALRRLAISDRQTEI
jgi:hypothetical protein